MSSKPNSASSKAKGSQKRSKPTETDYISREEQYKRLNEELEAKTANLVKEAEEVMKAQNSILSTKSRSNLLDNIDTQDFLRGFEDDTPIPDATFSYRDNPSDVDGDPVESQDHQTQSIRNRPPSKPKTVAQNRIQSPKSNLHKDGGADHGAATESREFSLENTINKIEGQITAGQLSMEPAADDVIPPVAADIGSEAQIRFLKAKLRVMQEEMDALNEACKKKDEETVKFQARIKELDDEKARLNRQSSTQQTQMERYKNMADDAAAKCNSTETQLSALRKEFENLKRSQKQQLSSQSATEVRLNRALEEVAKCKDQLQKARTSGKESVEQDKKKMEAVMTENKRLEKQKNELMTGFKKQLKLIDVLKRQKMHIEAAKMLAFSEEEFVKALEWGN